MNTENIKITPSHLPNAGILFADLEKEGRSGHLGHALVEYAPGHVLAFYPNCSAEDAAYQGHSGYGWMEYRRSEDGGRTWSDPAAEPNSKALFDRNCGRTLMCEKAVCTDTGRIVLFYLQCDMRTNGHVWEPFFEPLYAVSTDGCRTVSPARTFCQVRGRIYDARYHEGRIYVLFQRGAFCGAPAPETGNYYELYVSEDNGETFSLRSVLPFSGTDDVFYGTMVFRPDGSLLVYCYDRSDEHNLKYTVSRDNGHTWQTNRRAFFAKRLRNPQIAYFGGTYFIHGRSGNYGKQERRKHFVLYTSADGIHWDEGTYLRLCDAGYGAYSNNLVVRQPDGTERLLIQASHAYEENKTNVIQYWVDLV